MNLKSFLNSLKFRTSQCNLFGFMSLAIVEWHEKENINIVKKILNLFVNKLKTLLIEYRKEILIF